MSTDKLSYKKFAESKIGDNFSRPVLVASIAEANDYKGEPYVTFMLKDGNTNEKAKMFKMSSERLAAMGIVERSIADVTLKVDEFNNKKNFKVTEIRPASDTSLTIDDFIKTPPIDCGQMFDEICDLLKSSADDCGGSFTPLSELALGILNDHKSSFIYSAAATMMHHDFKGGLVYHSYRMTKTADVICKVYTSLDRELLLCGAALHDIGKIWEYNTSMYGDADITSSGLLMGHAYIGASLIKSYTEGKNYSKEKIRLLVHLILAHHGIKEWGAIALPVIPEAFALHMVDNLDAKMNMFEESYKTLEPGRITDKKVPGLDTCIYKPLYGER